MIKSRDPCRRLCQRRVPPAKRLLAFFVGTHGPSTGSVLLLTVSASTDSSESIRVLGPTRPVPTGGPPQDHPRGAGPTIEFLFSSILQLFSMS